MRAFPPRLQLALAALLFSTGGAAIKATSLSGWQVAGWRSGVAALVILLAVPEARRGWGWRPALVGLASGVTFLLFVVANKLTTAANTIFLQSAAPLYMALLGPFLLGERARRQDFVLMGLVAVGLALFFVGADGAAVATAPDPVRGNVLAALSGLTWALTVMGLRWMAAREGDHAVVAVVIGNLVAFAVGTVVGGLPGRVSVADVGTVLYLGVFQIATAYLLITSALRHVPALEASVILLIEPALSPFWAWLAHGERPGAWAITGGVLIIAATTVQSVLAARRGTGRPLTEVIE